MRNVIVSVEAHDYGISATKKKVNAWPNSQKYGALRNRSLGHGIGGESGPLEKPRVGSWSHAMPVALVQTVEN
jgi:hypothetical protein